MSSTGVPQPQAVVLVDDNDGMPSLVDATSWLLTQAYASGILSGNHRMSGFQEVPAATPSLHATYIVPPTSAVPKSGA